MSWMSKIKMYPVNLVIMQIPSLSGRQAACQQKTAVAGRQIRTEESMNKYRQYRKRFYMESANRVGGALTRLMQSKGECKKQSESQISTDEWITQKNRWNQRNQYKALSAEGGPVRRRRE